MEQALKNRIYGALSIALYIAFVFAAWYYLSTFLTDKEYIRATVSGYGIFAPIAFIFIQIAQNVIAPIAHYPILLAGGFIFGPLAGFFYNWIGTSIGTLIVVLLARTFGRPLVNKMVRQKTVEKYDHVVQKLSPFGLFLIYALPIFPDDEISYLIGLSAMPLKHTLFAILLGKIPGASLSFVGDGVIKGIPTSALIQVVVLIVCALFYFRKNIFKTFRVRNERMQDHTKDVTHDTEKND